MVTSVLTVADLDSLTVTDPDTNTKSLNFGVGEKDRTFTKGCDPKANTESSDSGSSGADSSNTETSVEDSTPVVEGNRFLDETETDSSSDSGTSVLTEPCTVPRASDLTKADFPEELFTEGGDLAGKDFVVTVNTYSTKISAEYTCEGCETSASGENSGAVLSVDLSVASTLKGEKVEGLSTPIVLEMCGTQGFNNPMYLDPETNTMKDDGITVVEKYSTRIEDPKTKKVVWNDCVKFTTTHLTTFVTAPGETIETGST